MKKVIFNVILFTIIFISSCNHSDVLNHLGNGYYNLYMKYYNAKAYDYNYKYSTKLPQ